MGGLTRDVIPARGRAGAPLALEIVRDLTENDILRVMQGEKVPGPTVPLIQRAKIAHHRQAQLIAQGLSYVDVAFRCDTTPARIHQLMDDPTFTELVAIYKAQLDQVVFDEQTVIVKRLVSIADEASMEIQERLMDPQKRAAIPTSELRQLTTMGTDRTVAPPKTAVTGSQPPANITFIIPGRGLNPEQPSEPKNVEPLTIENEESQNG